MHVVRIQAYPVMMGEIDPSGNLSANIIHNFTKQLRTKFVAQVGRVYRSIVRVLLFFYI